MKRIAYLVPLTIAVVLTGCVLRDTRAEPGEGATARVGIVNHTGSYIYFASVDGAGGGAMAAWGAGSANICCASIPRVWYPGMRVTVKWNMPKGVQDVITEKVVEVEKYDTPGDIYMNFFPNGDVRVVVSRNGPRAPDYPIPYKGKPADTPTSN